MVGMRLGQFERVGDGHINAAFCCSSHSGRRTFSNGRGFVPNVRQSLYSEIIATLAVKPQAAVGKDKDELPVATGLPRTWDEIAPGHLVIAQEALEYGWWEAIVLARTGDMLTLRFRDYPKLPKFARHRTAVALMSPPAE